MTAKAKPADAPAGVAAAVLAYTIWGLVVVYWKWLDQVSSWEVLAHRVAWCFVFLLPIVLLIRAMVRVLRDQDELERRIDLEAVAIAAMSTAFGFFSFGLLPLADIGWHVRGDAVAIWVMPCLFAIFGIAKPLVARRYRDHE